MLRRMSTQTVRLHRWDEIALEKVTEMLSRKVVTGEREMLAQVYLKRGCLVPMHSHESEQMTYILQGALKFLIGGEEITVREGEMLRQFSDQIADWFGNGRDFSRRSFGEPHILER